ncbi:rhodanese-related sulfurtransferase [Marmoricola sp. OAE513]|uniref:rhodanese-like domain-containing protein n=1 Tax=Marmoricola sp. OAE513 TaxID=2817894 RepID=UPI001AE505EE
MSIPTITIDQVPADLPAGVTLIDVREPVEWAHGHAPDAVHIPMNEIPERIAEIPQDGQVLVVCKVGGRSGQVVGYLVQNGYDAVNIDGGMLEWQAAGRPMVADAGEPTVF